MTLGRATPVRMDLAAFRLDEVEADRRPGVFRHRSSLRAVFARLRGRWSRAGEAADPDTQRPADQA